MVSLKAVLNGALICYAGSTLSLDSHLVGTHEMVKFITCVCAT
ncbi:hypothetical protein HAPS_0570 [Glaesserella parasuis SH0165]|uniref:Uncharacterized protein n=1 Tax=Glaesserella parasuis serovar 5 (strain SH0165) TaxID=557723 RepID=B8F4H2_GLAP5|nr:hypothetical protein HAPS_0570 [Glaesserella parasuis SH0165]